MVSNQLKIGLGMVVIFTGIIASVLIFGGENLVLGNVSNLSLVQNFRDFNCDAWNNLAVVRGEQVTVVGSGRTGFNPSFEGIFQTASLLTITDGSSEVDGLQISLVLNCDGSFIKHPTTVSGSMSFQLCGDPQGATTTCFIGDDRKFESLMGVASSTSSFFDVPIDSQAIPDDEPQLIWKGDISAFELERLFSAGDGTIHFKSIMLPVLEWKVNHPTLGIITINYNGITSNDPIISQYGSLRVIDLDADTDGDGIKDSLDGCINEPENFNGFQDEDGCIDVLPVEDTDGDGIIDIFDQCVSDPENFNGFEDTDGCSEVFVSTATTCSETILGVDSIEDIQLCSSECSALGGTWGTTIGMQTGSGGFIWNNGMCAGIGDDVIVIDEPETMMEMIEEMMESVGEEPVVEEVIVDEPSVEGDGEFLPPAIPPPIFEPLPPPISTPDVPITTTAPIADTVEEEQRNIVILLLLAIGVVAIIIVGIVNFVRKK
jgi:hypothetical protein